MKKRDNGDNKIKELMLIWNNVGGRPMIKIFIINVSIFVESFIILKTVYLFRNKTIDCNLQKIRNNQYYKVNVFSVIFHLLFILIFLLMFQNEVSLFDNYILIIVPAMFIMVLSCLWLVRYIFVYKF